MKFGFSVRDSPQHGGDLVAIDSIAKGLEELGHRVFFGPDASSVIKSDYIFISNTCLDQRPQLDDLLKYKKRWGVVPFHEDFYFYLPTMVGFINYVFSMFNDGSMELKYDRTEMSIEHLREAPNIVQIYGGESLGIPTNSHVNRGIFTGAETVFAHAEMEKLSIHNHIPRCKIKVVPWGCGIAENEYEYNDSFLKLTGMTKGEYILSIGRIEPRKNQLGSLISLYDVDIPLVLTTQKVYRKDFAEMVLQIAAKRKGPTIIISQDMEPREEGSLRVIKTGGLLKEETIASAYQNAGLHLHPAFYEMPGFTYLEAAKYNIPQVASNWGSIKEYFSHDGNSSSLNGRVEYVDPHNIGQIEEAVLKQFGKTFDPMYDHPALNRTYMDVAKDFLKFIIR